MPIANRTREGPTDGKILIVEDDDPVRLVIARMVRQFGFEALTAPAGDEGLALLREHRNDIRCVLLDLSSPVSPADALFGEFQHSAPSTPIIILTGFHPRANTGRFIERPPAAFMQKPFTVDTFRDTLERVVG